MPPLEVTAYDIAGRFIGIHEIEGDRDHPLIQWWLSLCVDGNPLFLHDEVPWCSAFVNGMAFILDLPRSHSAMARSWLEIGIPVPASDAKIGFDLVVLKRGNDPQPGPEVINAPGHVGFFGGWEGDHVWLRAGNQGNAVNDMKFPVTSILGIRRLVA